MKDKKIISDFGDEWNTYTQENLPKNEQIKIFNDYFSVFPFNKINKNSIGADLEVAQVGGLN